MGDFKNTGREAKRLLISADGSGSNGSRVRLWKWELQQLADETGLFIPSHKFTKDGC